MRNYTMPESEAIARIFPSNTAPKFARGIKFVQCAVLLTTSVFLFRSGMYASLSNLFKFHPNAVATIWGNLEMIAALLLLSLSFQSSGSQRSPSTAGSR